MDRELAKRILLTYRLGEAALPGSELAEALSLAEQDSELAVWLEDQLRRDRRIRSGLMTVAPPPGLRDAILRGRPQRNWRVRSGPLRVLALAAALAMAAGAGFVLMRRPSGGEVAAGVGVANPAPAVSFREQMAALLAEGRYSLQAQSPSLAELRQAIRRKGGVDDAVVPGPLMALGGYGCQVLKWEGHHVTLLCFNSPQMGFVHLLVLDAPPEAGIGDQPALASVHGWNTAIWQRGGRTYLLCAQGSDADLKSLLGS
ncbi:MAG: hypothetical protein RIS76_3667 [Verrucomicrobiota bacterium]|jgi:hypothetical protein